MKNLAVLIVVLVGVLILFQVGVQFAPSLLSKTGQASPVVNEKIVNEQSVVIDVVKSVGPSVVTVGAEKTSGQTDNSPFSNFFNIPQPTPVEGEPKEDYIGSGFIVDKSGLIVTNKHVVSDTSIKYVIVDSKGNKFNVANIYRDPLNDIAILKVEKSPLGGFVPIKFGNSDRLQVGQFVIAIGTALGEFRNTVTTGVVSGLGRGVSAGSPFEGFVERLDNVIQTDAAINPGNSGGPLLDVTGQVIGVNSAVASQGQNIGFAIPINIIRDSIKNFNETGQFNRPFLGVSYTIISKQAALLNELPEGALVREVVDGSAAQKAGITVDDIITKIDGQKITDDSALATIISKKKVGDNISITIWRDGKSSDLTATLTAASQ